MLRLKKGRLAQNSDGSISIGIPISLFKNDVTINEEAIIYKERNSIDRSLLSKASYSSFFRSPLEDRCFKKSNAFSDFRSEDKIDHLQKQFQEDFMWDFKLI